MLLNSVSVDMKVYALQLKQKSTADIFLGILRNARTATFENNLGRLPLKRKQWKRRKSSDPMVSSFRCFQENVHFLRKFLHSGAFQFGLCYHFYKPKKGLSGPVFNIKILVAETFGCYYVDN